MTPNSLSKSQNTNNRIYFGGGQILVTETKTARNKAIRSKVKTSVKKVYSAIDANDKEAALAALNAATVEIDKACTKGVYHKNNASRKVSRLATAVNKLS